MKNNILDEVNLPALDSSELLNNSGGFGWYPGYNEDAAAAGKMFWGSVGAFIDGVVEGYNDTRRSRN